MLQDTDSSESTVMNESSDSSEMNDSSSKTRSPQKFEKVLSPVIENSNSSSDGPLAEFAKKSPSKTSIVKEIGSKKPVVFLSSENDENSNSSDILLSKLIPKHSKGETPVSKDKLKAKFQNRDSSSSDSEDSQKKETKPLKKSVKRKRSQESTESEEVTKKAKRKFNLLSDSESEETDKIVEEKRTPVKLVQTNSNTTPKNKPGPLSSKKKSKPGPASSKKSPTKDNICQTKSIPLKLNDSTKNLKKSPDCQISKAKKKLDDSDILENLDNSSDSDSESLQASEDSEQESSDSNVGRNKKTALITPPRKKINQNRKGTAKKTKKTSESESNSDADSSSDDKSAKKKTDRSPKKSSDSSSEDEILTSPKEREKPAKKAGKVPKDAISKGKKPSRKQTKQVHKSTSKKTKKASESENDSDADPSNDDESAKTKTEKSPKKSSDSSSEDEILTSPKERRKSTKQGEKVPKEVNSKEKKPEKKADADHSRIVRLQRYLKEAGIRVKNYKTLWEDCTSDKERAEKLLELLQEHGLKGKPSLSECRKLKRKNEREKEALELNTSNIIMSEGRPRRGATNPFASRQNSAQKEKPSTSPGFKKVFSRLRNDIDSEASD